MPLEATMLILDTSEYMRNGDYTPSRFDAQADAVNTVVQTKLDSNAENTVGILTMAGKGTEVLITHTKELGQVLQAVHTASSKLSGMADIPTAIAIAQLALKHRQNKNLRQRVVVFLGSPLTGQGADEKNMVKLAKRLKKNNVAVDVVAFGDGIEEGESNVLRQFVDAANSSDNSHFLTVPPGSHLLSDALLRSPVLAGDIPGAEDFGEAGPSGAGAEGGGAGGGGGFEFGVDPTMDPELAMALRMSMEEEEARRAATAGTAGASSSTPAAGTAGIAASVGAAGAVVGAATGAVAAGTSAPADPTDDEEEALLQQALALSKEEGEDVEMDGADDEDEDINEEAEIARAIAMSMEDDAANTDGDKK